MPVQTSYPGVYVQEVPSGVRTISGVATSIATFIGRAGMGPMFQPVLCLNYSDFERTFSSDTSLGDMARAVRLFFLNGGTQCYIVRVANGAGVSKVDLKNDAAIPVPVLHIEAKSAGLIGDTIRMAVTYNSALPESLFNMEVFRWVKNAAGLSVKTDVEKLTGLSMDPKHPRYAGTYITQESKLINATDTAPVPLAGVNGFSQSGPIPSNILNTVSAGKQFSISVNGNAPVNVDLGTAAIADLSAAATVTAIEAAINTAVSPETVTVTAPAVGTNITLKIVAGNGDVLVTPAATNDVSGKLMLGTAQGGIEVSKYAASRPIPNGITFKISSFATFAARTQNAFNVITLTPASAGSPNVQLNLTLQTRGAANRMYEDNTTGSINGRSDGVREKWAIIADAINAQRNTDPAFPWSAELWGSRLAILPVSGGDNTAFNIVTSGAGGTNIGTDFTISTRYYSLGTLGTGTYQGTGVGGTNGNAPLITDYRMAFDNVDKEVDLFNLLILPRSASVTSATANTFWGEASAFCQKRRAFLLMDGPEEWKTVQQATNPTTGVNSLRMGLVKDHSAVFYPRLTINENGLNQQVGPSGAIAGLMARIDASRGVWKAAAGTEADLRGINGLEHRFSDGENGVLNPKAVNTVRIFPNGIVNWGARTMDGDDDFGSEYKYIPIRRTALFIEESLYRGLKWVVFEPNDEPLWSQIRLNVGAFMHNLFRQGAFQGKTKQDAYFVKCDSETTTQNDINLGIVNIWVGFAPLKPAEFVVLYLQQMTGQIQV
jgi:uncharacterized protein